MVHSMVALATAIAAGLLLSHNANAQDLPNAPQDQTETTGLAAYKAGDYATAFLIWDKQARAGNAAAAYNMGILYANGRLGSLI